ncbi:MAG: hypothetical protein M4579_000703 [Chaenotheca gracillima]|nr:MAG: hypothetical protein M4579_000703 [Chaenotheca gracillima]
MADTVADSKLEHTAEAYSDDGESLKINEKALLRKLDMRLLPALTLLYLLSFLDRSNVGNAKLEGLTKDLNMTGNQYLLTLTLYFVGYVIFEVCRSSSPWSAADRFADETNQSQIPCNIILKRTSPRAWLPTLTLLWGIVATLMGISQTFAGFVVVRFFLGATESGLFPGVVFYLSMWYKRNEQHYRVALFFSAASLAGAFGGILAYGIAHMDGVGGQRGWRWIFILEGLLTVVVSIGAYFFVHNYPATASFLSTEERTFITARLKADSDATQDEAFTWYNVSTALKDPKVWLYGLGFHTMSLPLYTLSLFLPTIITELGYTAAQAQLLTVPPYAVATILTISVAVASERLRLRAVFIMASSTVAAIGYIMLLSSGKPSVSYVGIFFAAGGIYPATALVLSWPANNVSGQTKRATANAMQISIGNLGAVMGTQLYRPAWAPRFFVGHGMALAYLLGNIVVVGTLWIILRRENKRRDEVMASVAGQSVEGGDWRGDEDIRWRFQT